MGQFRTVRAVRLLFEKMAEVRTGIHAQDHERASGMKDFSVHIINPRKKAMEENPRRRRRRRRKSTSAAAPRRRRRRRRRNPETVEYVTTNPRRRKSRRRRRAKNPSRARRYARAAFGGIGSDFRHAMPRFVGKLLVAWAVRRWGATFGGGGLFNQPHTSETAGGSWTLGQYILAYIAATQGARIVHRFLPMFPEASLREGGLDLLFTKLFWTEGIARMPWAVQQFGNTSGAYTYGAEGDVVQSADGQLWMKQGGQLVAMQGSHGGQLVTASPLDGQLVTASPLDGSGSYGYGHALSPDTDPSFAIRATYTRTGSKSAYAAPYLAGAM